MTTFTTTATIAYEMNGSLGKLMINPDSIVDVVISPIDHASGNTQLAIKIDKYFDETPPVGTTDATRYRTKLKYITRTPLSALPGARTVSADLGGSSGLALTTTDLVPHVNSALGITLAAADVVVAPIPGVLPANVTITMDPNNLVYQGSVVFRVTGAPQG